MAPVRTPAKTLPPPAPARAPPKAAQIPVSHAALLQTRIGATGVGKLLAARAGGKTATSAPGAPARAPSNDRAPATAPAAQDKSAHKLDKDAAASGKAKPTIVEGDGLAIPGGDGEKAAGAVRLHIPEPPTTPSKATMARIAGVQKRAAGAAAAQGTLPAADKQVADAQKAVTEPDAQRMAEARAQLIAQMHAAPSPEIEKLCGDIEEAIRRRRPPDEDALDKAEPAKEAMDAGATLNSTVETQGKKVADNYEPLDKPPEPAPATPAPPLTPQPAAAETAPPGARAAVPDAVPAGQVSLDKDADAARVKADEAGMNKPAAALVQSGPVAEAREAQGELDRVAKEDPAKVMAAQKEALGKANEDMGALQVRALAALTAHRGGTVGKATQHQSAMVGTEAQMREQAGTAARKAFTAAQDDVKGLLKDLVPNAMAKWEAARTQLTTTFKSDLQVVADHVKKRHESTLSAIADYFTGLPDWATEGYDKAEKNFASGVIRNLREISTEVDAIIKACEARIKQARDDMAVIFDALPASLKDWATKEQTGFATQLDKLGDEVHRTRDGFNADLGQRAAQTVDAVRAEIAELRKKAGGLVGRIANAVARFLDDPVKFIIEGLLELVGISPPAFWALVTKIKKVVKDIVEDPVNFANNLLRGIGQGFSQFFDNFPTHMIKGFLGWLLGDLKEVAVPKDFSLKSVITFFLQIMGITWPNIRKIIAKKIGEKNVALVERVWSLVSLLIDKGPEGIFEMIKDKLDPQAILDQVIQMAVEYMVTAIVKAVAARLILLFNPAGAILQAIEAIYKVLKWVFENAGRIFTLVETIVNGLADIVAGNVAGFANAVEKGLAMLIAPVLGFIADYLGFGDLPKAVAKQIKGFQKWILGIIEKAFDWLIEKGKALLAAVGIGKKDKDKKDDDKKAYDGQIGEVARWMGAEESHEMWIAETGGTVEVMMASGQKGPVRAKLTKYEAEANTLRDGPGSKVDIKDRQTRAFDAIKSARQKLGATEQAAKATKSAITKKDAKPDDVKAKDQETEDWQEKLWPELQIIEIALDRIPMPKTKIHGGSGQATTVTARPLSKDGSGGGKPSGKLRGWPLVAGRNPQWVAAHLVSEKLHGPGAPWNTTPMRTGDNTRMERAVENDAKDRVAKGEVLYYTASVTYHQDADDPRMNDFPSAISVRWGALRYLDKAWVDDVAYKPYDNDELKKPDLDNGATPDINELRRTALYKRDVPIRFAMAMDDERDSGGPFTGMGSFKSRMTAVYKVKGGNPDDRLDEGIAAVRQLIDDKKAKWPK